MKVGILGAGQLGRMLAEAGKPLGMEFRFLDPATEISARDLGEHVCAAFEDVEALEEFHQGLDVITYEFENVPFESVRWLSRRVPVYPNAEALATAQDRLYEKRTFEAAGIPVPNFADLFFRDEYHRAIEKIGYPAVLKTRRFGYDGKGQRVIRNPEEAANAWTELNGLPLFLEGFVPFQRELSLLSVRGRDGEYRAWPLVWNTHREGILRLSIAPAPAVSPSLQATAEAHARRIMNDLDYVGVLAIEFFEHDGVLVANEMAPRVHNSGHWSIEGAACSQFENHLRAIAGLPLGSVQVAGFSAMVNLIGDVPTDLPTGPNYHFHDYGKRPRAGRKLAHLTITAADPEQREELLKPLRDRV